MPVAIRILAAVSSAMLSTAGERIPMSAFGLLEMTWRIEL